MKLIIGRQLPVADMYEERAGGFLRTKRYQRVQPTMLHRIRDFTLEATGERRTGVIAQEMMKVHPEMVRLGATGFYQVDVPDAWRLIKAIQELKAENDDLVTRARAVDDALKTANDNIADLRASFEAYKDAHP
jgi:hypothetical protein